MNPDRFKLIKAASCGSLSPLAWNRCRLASNPSLTALRRLIGPANAISKSEMVFGKEASPDDARHATIDSTRVQDLGLGRIVLMRIVTAIVILASATPVSAGVVVLGNYTPAEVSFTLAAAKEQPRKFTIPAFHVMPYSLNGPGELVLVAGQKPQPYHIEPHHAYVLIPDRMNPVRLEALELPGKAPERDNRPELNPMPRAVVSIPVTLLVDDVDPRTDRVWQGEVRKRFETAAEILEAQTGTRLEFAGFSTWKSEAKANHPEAQLATFEAVVKVKPGALAVGFTSQKLDNGEGVPFGACRGLGSSHVLVREWRPRSEIERVEVLVRYLAVALGAVSSPDPGSALRPRLGDGQALASGFVIRLDPLNVLALNLLADLRRAELLDLIKLPEVERTRLTRVYSALLAAAPGDPLAMEYLGKLEPKDVAQPGPDLRAKPIIPQDRQQRMNAIRAVLQAVQQRAEANSGPGALVGEALTNELIRSAAQTALALEEVDRIAAFLIGVGIALDDSNSLFDDPVTGNTIRGIESISERKLRQTAQSNPTLKHRRDLVRWFAHGCAIGELLTPTAAENSAVSRQLFDLHRPVGLSIPALASEISGITFAGKLQGDPQLLKRIANGLDLEHVLPNLAGLRDGFGIEKFEEVYGGVSDDRFRKLLAELRQRVKNAPLYREPPR